MRKVRFVLEKESFSEMTEAGRMNPALKITFQDKKGKHTHTIATGHYADIFVFRENGQTFVLAQSRPLSYIGLEVFRGDEKTGEIFLNDHRIEKAIGRSDLAPYTTIRRLMPYMGC